MPIPIHNGVLLRHVFAALEELSNKDEQRREWLASTSPASFIEACETLFTDSGLSHELERGFRAIRGGHSDFVQRPIFDEQIDGMIEDLRILLDRVDQSLPPELMIESPAMARVRSQAAELVSTLQTHLGGAG